MSPTILDRSSGRSPAEVERDRILEGLLEARPALAARISRGPSGALTIPLTGGRHVEIGRLPRRGRARWVVVSPAGEGAVVHEPRGTAALVRAVLRALDGAAAGTTGGAGVPVHRAC